MSNSPDLRQRLSALLMKTAQPFRQLLDGGQITEDVVSIVLDAGELAGDTSRLIGFAAAYLHLRAQGVPVHDVVRMAKRHGRRVNLGWSEKRWRSEHDRLSRCEALERLSNENVGYDVSRFEAPLPDRFYGYLTAASRSMATPPAGAGASWMSGGKTSAASCLETDRAGSRRNPGDLVLRSLRHM